MTTTITCTANLTVVSLENNRMIPFIYESVTNTSVGGKFINRGLRNNLTKIWKEVVSFKQNCFFLDFPEMAKHL